LASSSAAELCQPALLSLRRLEDEDLAGLLVLLVKVQTFILTLSFD
jgi:hypothetical protein